MNDADTNIRRIRAFAATAKFNYRAAAPELLAYVIGGQLTNKLIDAVPTPWSWLVALPWIAWVLYCASPGRLARREVAEMERRSRYTDEYGDGPRREYR